MALSLADLPRFLVLEPLSTVRVEMRLAGPACEIDVELDNPEPGRSFVLLIGHKEGPFVQRVRLAGKARIYFDPQSPGEYVLLMANPQKSPITLRLRARDVGLPPVPKPESPDTRRPRPQAPRTRPSTRRAPMKTRSSRPPRARRH